MNWKAVIIVVALFVLNACVPIQYGSESPYYGVGEFNSDGYATGEWQLYASGNDSLMAKGSYIDGQPVGTWTLWDSGGSRNAELNYDNGRLEGEYRLFYTSFTPQSSGKLKTIGHAEHGVLQGRFQRYNPDGSLMVEYTADHEQVTAVVSGELTMAQGQLTADRKLLDVYGEILVHTPQTIR